jgi:hypothetical protein
VFLCPVENQNGGNMSTRLLESLCSQTPCYKEFGESGDVALAGEAAN